MQEARDPQRSATGPLAPPPIYPVQPSVYAAPPVKAGRWLRFRRMLRLLLRRLLYGTAIVGRALRPFAGFVVAIVALLGVIGWMSYLLWGPKEAASTFTRAQSLPPASAIENYIQGQQNYDADLMWEAYSADYKSAQLQRGADKAVLQSQADSQRSRGLQYVHHDYIGGVKLEDGRQMYFYTIDLALDTQHATFPFIFTANADGKIEDIDSPFTRPQTSSQ